MTCLTFPDKAILHFHFAIGSPNFKVGATCTQHVFLHPLTNCCYGVLLTTGSTPLFPYPENLPGDAFPANCPCGHPCGVCLQPPSLDYPPLSTCLFECETVQGALTKSSPVLTEAEKAALLFSVACRTENPPVWQSQVSTNNLSPSLNETSFVGSQVIPHFVHTQGGGAVGDQVRVPAELVPHLFWHWTVWALVLNSHKWAGIEHHFYSLSHQKGMSFSIESMCKFMTWLIKI